MTSTTSDITSEKGNFQLRDRSLFTGRGGRRFWRGHFFWKVADVGLFLFGAKIFEKANETHFSTRFGQK